MPRRIITMGTLDADAYPLYWPELWPRTPPHERQSTARYKVSFAEARDRVVHSCKLLGAIEIVLSTNIPLRRDGLPRMDISEPTDAGVALYWVERKAGKPTPRVIACDHWRKVRDNMRAIGLAVEALRALKRSGATQIADKAFTGFNALPANAGANSTPWRDVFGPCTTREALEHAYREASRSAHPDLGGSHERMIAVNAAYAIARLELGV
jgi:hypothetical protein